MAKGNFESVGGRQTHFGPRGLDAKWGRGQSRVGQNTEVVFEVNYDDLPVEASAANEMVYTLPSGALINRVTLVALEAFDGTDGAAGSNFLLVGLQEPDGTEIDNDGLIVIDALTEIDADNETVVGAGALVDTAISAKGQLVVTLDGSSSLTAGKAKIYVEYTAPEADAAGVKTY
jgi:hypothetical protein